MQRATVWSASRPVVRWPAPLPIRRCCSSSQGQTREILSQNDDPHGFRAELPDRTDATAAWIGDAGGAFVTDPEPMRLCP